MLDIALNNFSILLSKTERQSDAERLSKLADNATWEVERGLWSEENNSYLDMQQARYDNTPYRILTEDISLYLVAITDNTYMNSLNKIKNADSYRKGENINLKVLGNQAHQRALGTLNSIKTRAWKEKWPLITEGELKATGPWVLKPYEYHYHNSGHGLREWKCLLEVGLIGPKSADTLLSKLASQGHPHVHALYEWINPINDQENGVYPFRTGISSIRIAIADMLGKRDKNNPKGNQ